MADKICYIAERERSFRMMKLTIALVVALPSLVASLPVDVVTRHRQLALDHVKSACGSDVEKLCSRRARSTEAMPPMVMLHPMRISSILDDMMNTALSTPQQQQQQQDHMTITFFSSDNEMMSPDLVFDGMLSSLFSQVQSTPKPPMSVKDLTKKVVEVGHDMLAKEQDEGRRRLARRLAEVDPKQMTTKSLLPFHCSYQNSCLHAAYEQGVVSSQCSRAIQYLEEVPRYSAQSEIFADRYRRAMLPMLWVYALLCMATLVAIRRRYRKQWLKSDKRQMNAEVIQTVFSNPQLKAQVEDILGKSLGAVPPVSRRALEKMGGGVAAQQRFRVCFAMKVAFLLSLVVLVFVMPCVVLPICIVSVFARLCYIACCMPAVEEGKCVCCCCAGSTEDVKNGTVSAQMACCTCCNGTGVCAVACVSCCGTGDDGCSCCSHGCDCCSDKKKKQCNETECELKVKLIGQGQKHTFAAKDAEVYCGIPVQVV